MPRISLQAFFFGRRNWSRLRCRHADCFGLEIVSVYSFETLKLSACGNCFVEDFGEVHDSDGFLFSPDQTVHVHEAGHVVGCEDFGSRGFVIGDPVLSHHDGNGFLADCERSAEAAAFVGASQFADLDAFQILQQEAGFVKGQADEF